MTDRIAITVDGTKYIAETRRDEDGWTGEVPELPGCITWAPSQSELLLYLRNVIRCWLIAGKRIDREGGD